MVTSTSSENLFYQCYGFHFQNQNFDFKTTKTLILHAWSIFFKGAHPTKLWSKKLFSMKTLSKLGALTVLFCDFFLTFSLSLKTDVKVPSRSNNKKKKMLVSCQPVTKRAGSPVTVCFEVLDVLFSKVVLPSRLRDNVNPLYLLISDFFVSTEIFTIFGHQTPGSESSSALTKNT
jgi:hypothetical protein